MVDVAPPHINDERVDETGQRKKSTSDMLAPYMRRSPKDAEVLPILSLQGLSTGDLKDALSNLLGDDAVGLSAR